MKKHIFLTAVLSALLFSIALFTGCHDRDTALPEKAEAYVLDDDNSSSPSTISNRATCVDAECTVDIDVTPNGADYDVCGIATSTSPPPCVVSYSCGGGDDVAGEEDSFTGDNCFCATHDRKFLVRNTGTANITVNADAGASQSGNITIQPGEYAVFEAESDCDINWICTE